MIYSKQYISSHFVAKEENAEDAKEGACEAVFAFDMNQHDASPDNLAEMKKFAVNMIDNLDDKVSTIYFQKQMYYLLSLNYLLA